MRPALMFEPGPLTRQSCEALNQLARDLYSFFQRLHAAPPLQSAWDASGIRVGLNQQAVDPQAVVRLDSIDPETGPRRRLNLIGGAGITLGVVDDPIDNELDITITASGSGSTSSPYPAGLSFTDPDYAEPFPQPPGHPPATPFNEGTVTTVQQSFAGIKEFQARLYATEVYVSQINATERGTLSVSTYVVSTVPHARFTLSANGNASGTTSLILDSNQSLSGNHGACVLDSSGTTGNGPAYAVTPTDGVTYYGAYGTSGGGDTVKAGLVITLGSGSTLQIGVTPVSGGASDNFLYQDSAGHLNSVAPGLTTTF